MRVHSALYACRSQTHLCFARDKETWWKNDAWTGDGRWVQSWKGQGSESQPSASYPSRKRGKCLTIVQLCHDRYEVSIVFRCARSKKRGKASRAGRCAVLQVQRVGSLRYEVPKSEWVLITWPGGVLVAYQQKCTNRCQHVLAGARIASAAGAS